MRSWRDRHSGRRVLCGVALGAAVAAGVWAAAPPGAPVPASSSVVAGTGAWDWPSYGHDAQHTFHGRTTLTEASVRTLRTAWFFKTGDAVTATPTVVGGTVYAGAWDDSFYAVNLATGKLRWKVQLHAQNAITPYPGQHPRDVTSDGGLVTSSAWFEPAGERRPALVIFSGGYTLYALNAGTGAVYWEHDYRGLPGPPSPNADSTRIFSSPVVADGRVIVGVDVDGQKGSRGYVVAASLDSRQAGLAVPDGRRCQRTRAVRQLRQRLVVGHGPARQRDGRVRDGGLQLRWYGALCRLGARAAHRRRHPGLEVPPHRQRPGVRRRLRRHRQRRSRRGRDDHLPRRGQQGRHLLLLGPADRQAALVDQRGLRRVVGGVHRHAPPTTASVSTERQGWGTSARGRAAPCPSATRPIPATR